MQNKEGWGAKQKQIQNGGGGGGGGIQKGGDEFVQELSALVCRSWYAVQGLHWEQVKDEEMKKVGGHVRGHL